MKSLGLIFTIILLSSCASIESTKTSTFSVEHDAVVTDLQGKTFNVVKGKRFTADRPIMIESPGRVGLLVVPQTQNNQDMKLNLKPIVNFGGEQIERLTDVVMSEIMDSVYQAQLLLGSGKASDALVIIQNLRGKYPHISYLMLIESSCLVTLGRKSQAIELLSEFKRSKPGNKNVNSFLNQLQNKSRVPAEKSRLGQ